MPWEVSTPVFAGPVDLLLHLVNQHQVELHDLPIAPMVDAFVEHLERMEQVDLDVATEFLLVAAILVELKARRLLPGRGDVEPEEELAIWEERDLMLARLLECRTFKAAGVALDRRMGVAALSRPRTAGMEEPFFGLMPDVLAGVTPERLRDACRRALTPRPVPRVLLDHVAPIRVSVAEVAEQLARQLPVTGPTTFREITAGLADRIEQIVRFLALLELYKDGLVDLDQATRFGELRVTWVGSAEGVTV